MLSYWWVILIGVLGGAAVGIQGVIAAAMGQRVGSTASSFIVHLSGLLLSGALLWLQGGQRIRAWPSLPWYMLGAGVFGVILYLTISVTMPRLGATMMITLIIIGQLTAGILIDQFGWLGVPVHALDAGRVAGVLVLLAGGYLLSR